MKNAGDFGYEAPSLHKSTNPALPFRNCFNVAGALNLSLPKPKNPKVCTPINAYVLH